MKNYGKTFVMFFRGKDDSNKVSSATKTCLENEMLAKFINFEFINLDKRNFEKYFDKLERLPDVVYVWHDEEILIDYLNEKHPGIEVRIYDMKNSLDYKGDLGYSYGRKARYIIAQNIISEYKESQGTTEFWIAEKDEAKLVTISNYDYEHMSSWTKAKYFTSEEFVKADIKKRLEEDLINSEEMIKHYQKKIKETKKKLKKFD